MIEVSRYFAKKLYHFSKSRKGDVKSLVFVLAEAINKLNAGVKKQEMEINRLKVSPQFPPLLTETFEEAASSGICPGK